MATLQVPSQCYGNGFVMSDDATFSDFPINHVVEANGNSCHHLREIEDLSREDLGLKTDDDDDLYDGLIKDFRTKLDSLSFKRLDQNQIKAQAADFKAQREHEKLEKGGSQPLRFKKRRNATLMLPAIRFQELDDGECIRRDTESSGDRSRVSSGASGLSSIAGKSRSRWKTKSNLKRATVMGNIMKRGRTVRKTLRSRHINDAGGSDHVYGTPPTSEQKLRMFVLKEIFDTETEYMKLLQFMSEVMSPYLQKMGDDPERAKSCGKDTVTQLLSNVKDIYSLHVSFQSALQDILIPAPFHTHCIGKIFLQFKDKFSIYDEYCGNFSKAQKLCYEIEKDPDLQEIIKEWKTSVESKSRRFLHLEGFVISPVQRLCKYPLLLRELKKRTPSNHKDYKDVEEAQTVMDEVTKSVNESEKRQLMIQAIRDMESMNDSWEQSGFITKQGFLTKRGGSVKSWYIRWFILRGYKLAYYNEPTDVRPLGVLDLTSYRTFDEDVSEHVGRPFAFGIKMPDRTYYMYSITEEEKQEWINVLKWKFDCIDRSRRQTHHPFETVVFSSISSFIHPKSNRSEADDFTNGLGEYSGQSINNTQILSPTGDPDDVFKDEDSSETDDKPRSKSMSRIVKFNDKVTINEVKDTDTKKRTQSQKQPSRQAVRSKRPSSKSN